MGEDAGAVGPLLYARNTGLVDEGVVALAEVNAPGDFVVEARELGEEHGALEDVHAAADANAGVDVAEVIIRGDVELIEEDIRHVGVKMLAGVDDDFPETLVSSDGTADGGGLDELRPGAEDGEDFHGPRVSILRPRVQERDGIREHCW